MAQHSTAQHSTAQFNYVDLPQKVNNFSAKFSNYIRTVGAIVPDRPFIYQSIMFWIKYTYKYTYKSMYTYRCNMYKSMYRNNTPLGILFNKKNYNLTGGFK